MVIRLIWILPAPPSSSSGQGGPIGTRGPSHAGTCLGASDNPQNYKTQQWYITVHLINCCIHWRVLFFMLVRLENCFWVYDGVLKIKLTPRRCLRMVHNLQPSCCIFLQQRRSPRVFSGMDQVQCSLRHQRLKHQQLQLKLIQIKAIQSLAINGRMFSVHLHSFQNSAS